jgi:hypothetical protein
MPSDGSPYWTVVSDSNPRALALYERHYSARHYRDGRRRRQFVGPGERLVLLSPSGDALLAWRVQRYTKDGQRGVCCCCFRNESTRRSSDLLISGMRLAWQRWPRRRLFTYVNPRKIRSTNPGCCFKAAGWRRCGRSKGGLIILDVRPPDTATPKRASEPLRGDYALSHGAFVGSNLRQRGVSGRDNADSNRSGYAARV